MQIHPDCAEHLPELIAATYNLTKAFELLLWLHGCDTDAEQDGDWSFYQALFLAKANLLQMVPNEDLLREAAAGLTQERSDARDIEIFRGYATEYSQSVTGILRSQEGEKR